MGNRKFKLTNMIPNAWFYKLKNMNKTSKTLKNHHHPPAPPSSPPTTTIKTPPQPELQCPSRKSYHITRELTIDLPNELDSLLLLKLSPPRKSKSSTKSRKSNRRSCSISTCSCQSSSTFQSYRSKSYSPPSPDPLKETDIKNVGFSAQDALFKVNNKQSILKNAVADKPEHFNVDIDVDKMSLHTNINNNFDHMQLPPIITKQESKQLRRMTINSPGGVKLKINSPRIIGRKQGQNGNKNGGRRSTCSKKRRSISESFAVVKSSFDPQRDFKESMVEMILQNNLTAAKDLEDLLACYLSLNSDEYHDVIIKVFKQIWIDLRHCK